MTLSKTLTAAGIGAALAASALVVSAPPAAQATDSHHAARPPAQHVVVTAQHPRVHMGRYLTADFAAQAKKLPSGLVHAVNAQLGIGGAVYLARAAAAAQARPVLDALRASGVHIAGSKLDGTALDVYVSTAADAAAVTSAGATPLLGRPPAEPKTVRVDALSGVASTSPVNGGSQLRGGDVWGYDSTDDFWVYCSVGFNGYDKTTGIPEFLTAGHCNSPANADYHPAATGAWAWFDTQAETTTEVSNGLLDAPEDTTKSLGTLNTSNFRFGSGDDFGTVPISAATTTQAAAVTTWGGSSSTSSSTGFQNTGVSVSMQGVTAPIAGMSVCHSGGSTGFQCGTLDDAVVGAIVGGTQQVNGFTVTMCTIAGDSGGPFVSGSYAVGVLSGGVSCSPGDQGHETSVGYGLLSSAGYAGAHSVYNNSNFELAVQVSTPQVTTANAVQFAGVLPAGAVGTKVSLSIDGGAFISTTSTTDANSVDQDWSFQLSGLSSGTHAYTVQASYGTWSTSSRVSSSFVAQVITPGTVEITGAAVAHQQLAAVPTGFSAAGSISYSYAWTINGAAASSTSSRITAAEDTEQDDSYIVRVTASSPGMQPITVTSDPVTVPKYVRTFDSFAPMLTWVQNPVTGVATITVGSGLPTAVTPVTTSYAWWIDGVQQPGQTGTQLIVVSRSSAHTIIVQVTVSAPSYQTEQAISAALQIPAWVSVTKPPTQTPPPAVALPRIAPKVLGAAKIGSKLSVTFPRAYPAGTMKRFQWYVNGKPIAGATMSTFMVPVAAAGKKIVVKVTASLGGQVESVPSVQTKTVAKGTLRAGGVKITGTRKAGHVIAVHRTGAWTTGVELRIQWFEGGHAIKGATRSTLKLSSAMAGKKISVKLTASKAGYATVTKTAK